MPCPCHGALRANPNLLTCRWGRVNLQDKNWTSVAMEEVRAKHYSAPNQQLRVVQGTRQVNVEEHMVRGGLGEIGICLMVLTRV